MKGRQLQFKISFEAILLTIIVLPVFVDQLNGFLQYELGVRFSISQIIKFGYLLVIFSTVMLLTKKARLIFLMMLFVFILPLFLNILTHRQIFTNIFFEVGFITKLMTFPLITLFFLEVGVRNKYLISEDLVEKSVKMLFFTLLFALLLSLAGFGVSMYEDFEEVGIGYKGYFIAGNELSAFFLIVYAYHLFFVFRKDNNLRTIFTILLALVIAVLMTTKTALLAFILVSVAVPVFYEHYMGKTILEMILKYRKILWGGIFSSIILMFGLFFMFEKMIMAFVTKLEYAFNKSGSIITLLLSARDKRYAESFKLFNEYGLVEKLFGTSVSYRAHYILERMYGWGSAETDWLDLLVSYGLVGMLVIYGFWFWVLFLTYRSFRKRLSVYSVPSIISISLLIINTTFSGHIVYSALTGMYLAYFVSLQFVEDVNK